MPRGGTTRRALGGTTARRDVGEWKDSDKHIIQSVNDILSSTPVDVSRLRKISAVCGLSCTSLRARVWPILLGVTINDVNISEFIDASKKKHKDTTTVEVSLLYNAHEKTDSRYRAFILVNSKGVDLTMYISYSFHVLDMTG